MEFGDVLARRRSVRTYDDRPVPREVLERVAKAAVVWAPSAGFSQGLRIVVVTDADTRREIATAAMEDDLAAKGRPRWKAAAPVHMVVLTRDGLPGRGRGRAEQRLKRSYQAAQAERGGRPLGEVELIRSPDGRVWTLDRIRPKLSEAETFKVPFFWSSVVATIVLLAFIARVVWVDQTALAYFLLVPFGVWIVERGFHALRPFIRAETEDPPRETLMWRPSSRWGYGRVERRITEAIESGRPETDVKGAPLVRSG